MSDTIIGRKFVKTRKPHVCFGCGREFQAGTMMEKSFVIDWRPWSCYICETCFDITQDMDFDGEFGFSDLREEALEREKNKKSEKND